MADQEFRRRLERISKRCFEEDIKVSLFPIGLLFSCRRGQVARERAMTLLEIQDSNCPDLMLENLIVALRG
jgi:hypothetical protein